MAFVLVVGVTASSVGDTTARSSSATGPADDTIAPTSSDFDTIDFSDDEILAMLVTENDVDGRAANPLLIDDGSPRLGLCAEAGPVSIFDEAPQASTFVRGHLTSVRQFISVGNESAQRARFDESAAALDRCHGTGEKFSNATITIHQIKHASIPVDARLYRKVVTLRGGRECSRQHFVYTRVGPVLTELTFDGFQTYRMPNLKLPIRVRAAMRLGQRPT